jgi:hypothetical protein
MAIWQIPIFINEKLAHSNLASANCHLQLAPPMPAILLVGSWQVSVCDLEAEDKG